MSKPYETFEAFGLPLAFENIGAMHALQACRQLSDTRYAPCCDLRTLYTWPERGVKESCGETQ